jgi:ABC-type dipeptide/oligopeptide/nickel transport system permease component
MRILPGDPFTSEKRVSPDALAAVRAKYGLDKPILEAYFIYIFNFLRFDWGTSFAQRGQEVTGIMASHAPYSIQLGLLAFAFMVVVGIPLGIIAALNHNKPLDYIATGFSLFFFSIPTFVLGLLALVAIVFVNTNFNTDIPITKSDPHWNDLLLPALVLGIRPASIVTRLTRASMLEVLGQDYIRTAWAKGLSQRMLILRHALKNALIPIVTVLGDYLGFLIVGSVTIEAVFAIPGIGNYLVDAIKNRDYPVIMITSIIYAMVVVFINLIVDLLYGLLDPRIKYTTRKVVA